MVFDRANERVRQQIINELGIDVAETTRQRKYVEGRCLYYVIFTV